MKNNQSTRVLILLTHLLTAIAPVLILGIPYIKNSQGGNGGSISIVAVAGLLTIIGLAAQFIVAGRFAKIIALIVEAMKKAQKGDLSTNIEGKGYFEAKELIDESNALIKLFREVLSKVEQSTEEVKHLTNTVSSTSKEASVVAKEISSSSEFVSKGATKQAEDAEECSNVTTELVDSFEDVKRSADLMEEKADTAKEMAEFGKTNISELLEKSKLSEKNMQDISSRINDLSDMAQNIGHITTTITDIASQTNLLSLNASIEAARAGEMGRGFAVVAGEIKKLAEQSVASSQEIRDIITGIQNQVSLTTGALVSTSSTMEAQTESVHKTNEAFIGISNAVEELFEQLVEVKKGISVLANFKQILSDSITNIAAVAQETAASTEEITSLMYSQTNSAEILVQLSESFTSVIENLERAIYKFNIEKSATVKKSFAIIPCIDVPFFYDTHEGAKDAAEKIGVDVLWYAPKSFDPKVQAAMIDEAVSKGVSGIGVGPVDGPEVRGSIKKALEKGIKVVYFDTDVPGTGRQGFIGTDNYKAGKALGELVAKKINGKGSIIGSTQSKVTLNMKQRIDGFMEVIKKYPGINIIEIECSEQTDVNIRWQNIKKIIQRVQSFDCFVCMDSHGSFFAKKIKEDLGITPNSVVFDKTENSEKPLKDGYLTVLAQRPRLWGELSVRRLNELCNGKTIQDAEDTGTFEINKTNMKVFIKDIAVKK